MWQNFFEKEKKFLNPYIERMKNYKDYIMYEKEKMNLYKGSWKEYFKNDNPIYLEIGSGAGNFIARSGEKVKDKNFIGIEIKFKRLVLAAQKCKKRNLKNVLLLRRRGEEILEFLGKSEISGLYINFPDPWEKEKQRKNRMIQQGLFDNLDVIMKKGGKIFFKTDHKGYYMDVLELMKDIKGYKIVFNTEDLHSSDRAKENVSTEFEDMFLKKGMKINYIEIEKEV
ncbi:tRNA (guanosine(46)-N7)-methyltransferase TrmB [Haliovirga abyssi]|uniref:tRNA (guanine-N(7)-)-methyltransferase n=1 Tax=Haliovirga abyssi TaxID=2996794 RepID=A0AAU9DLZ1_9FUSO|nr:tRNA (guanosine(46)-N7)-methyltransferase TrmB [Haliovirga abyssi]BDU50997.1 hypothetical protein HLVA_15660 [Haliovirga abyssi]